MDKRKRILFYLMQGGSAGGSDTCLYLLIKFLDLSKFEPYLLYDRKSKFIDELEKLNINIIHIDLYSTRKRSASSKTKGTAFLPKKLNNSNIKLFISSLKHLIKRIPDIIKLVSIIRKFNIDIVHTNHYLTADRAMLIASILLGKITISHNRGLYRPDSIDIIVAKFIDLIINMSLFSQNVYTKNGVNEIKCVTIYDGIDTEMYQPQKVKEEDIVIGCFGRLEHWKGQQTLIDAAEIILRKHSKIKFMIVGNGPDEKELKESVNEKNLGTNFIFTGHITNVKEYMNKCSIIVHTSIEPEPFGMVIIEAMSLEKPVIATKIGGPLEIISDQEDGFLVNPQDFYELASKILNLINNVELRYSIGKKAREKVLTKFDVKEYVSKVEKIYEKVIDNE